MTVVNLPYPDFQPNTLAVADQIDGNNAAIVNVVNGALDDSNLANNGITASSKVKDGTVDAACMGTAVVRQAQMDYTAANLGVKAVQAGPNYVGAAGIRFARVSKSVTPTALATEDEFTITFASNALDGDPAFTAAPQIYGIEFTRDTAAQAEMVDYYYIRSVSTTQVAVRCVYPVPQDASPVAMVISFLAAGAI